MSLAIVCALALSAKPTWTPLFDGKTTKGWHGFKETSMPPGWSVLDGSLVLTPADKSTDISTDEVYSDFDLKIDWKISKGGNSGIMYRADEGHAAPWYTGPEYQVLDDARHSDGRNPLTSAGSCYGLYACSKKAVKPAEQWNSARIVAKGNHIQHWLNGIKVVDYVLWSKDWTSRLAKTKFTAMPDYGTLKEGHIVLQNHGNAVSYRNIKIRRL